MRSLVFLPVPTRFPMAATIRVLRRWDSVRIHALTGAAETLALVDERVAFIRRVTLSGRSESRISDADSEQTGDCKDDDAHECLPVVDVDPSECPSGMMRTRCSHYVMDPGDKKFLLSYQC